MRLSQKMVLALEHLNKTDGQADWVTDATAFALQSRRLGKVAQRRRRTTGGQFPDSWLALTDQGRKWCEWHFAKGLASADLSQTSPESPR
jgi:hypothetical protein